MKRGNYDRISKKQDCRGDSQDRNKCVCEVHTEGSRGRYQEQPNFKRAIQAKGVIMFFEIYDIRNNKHVINSDKIIQIKEQEITECGVGLTKIGNLLIVLDCSEFIVITKAAYNYLDAKLKIER